jgi:hypothetical protein
MAIANTKTNKNVNQLNSFLRGERSAVEAYRIAIEQLGLANAHRDVLQLCLESHQRRAVQLADRIEKLGGQPSTDSGPWGTFTGAVEKTAAVLSESAAIAALESGEDHGLADYERDIDELTPDLQGLVSSDLLPAQQDTHHKMSSLKKSLEA